MDRSLDRAALASEFAVFARCLLGRAPEPGWVATYVRAHEAGTVEVRSATSLDRALLALARVGPAATRLADSFAAVFSRAGLLRRKLVLVLAILESHASSANEIDAARAGSRLLWVGVAALMGLAGLVRLLIAAIIVFPLWVLIRATGATERRPS